MGVDDIQKLFALGSAERLALAERLLESVAQEADAAPLSDAEKEFIAQRLAEHRANPGDVVPWSEVKISLGL